ncbi:hypothetical protein LINGRAHAP2_LOCUS1854, partial [Linum grandiflorum]
VRSEDGTQHHRSISDYIPNTHTIIFISRKSYISLISFPKGHNHPIPPKNKTKQKKDHSNCYLNFAHSSSSSSSSSSFSLFLLSVRHSNLKQYSNQQFRKAVPLLAHLNLYQEERGKHIRGRERERQILPLSIFFEKKIMSHNRLPATTTTTTKNHKPVLSPDDKPFQLIAVVGRILILLFVLSFICIGLYTAFFDPITGTTTTTASIALLPLRSPHPRRTAVANFSATNISHVLFALSGSNTTWRDRSRFSSIWWTRDQIRGYVWLEDDDGGTVSSSADPSAAPTRVSSPEWSRFGFSSSRPAVRIARIISDSFGLKLPGVRWFVMGDDDTVFFPENLVSLLGKYDHREMWYIGGNSESVEQDVMHSYDMAFGGGGFAISYPLAQRLVQVLDGCLERFHYFYGSDQRIWACITEIGVGLTPQSGFHQLDIRGSAYGILAAHPLSPLISLHHLDTLEPLFPGQDHITSVKSLYKAYRVDPPRILQSAYGYDHQFNWSVSISWGYTVQLYPTLVAVHDLQVPLQTFKTWRSFSDGPFTFNTRPTGPDPCAIPIVFMLDKVQMIGTWGTLTVYKRMKPAVMCKRPDFMRAMSVQRIAVSSLTMEPDYWSGVSLTS